MQVDNKSILFYTESKRLPKDTLLISVVSQKIEHHLLYFKYGLTILKKFNPVFKTLLDNYANNLLHTGVSIKIEVASRLE